MKLKPTAQVKKIENRINSSMDLSIDQILFDQYYILYCIDQIEFVNRKKN